MLKSVVTHIGILCAMILLLYPLNTSAQESEDGITTIILVRHAEKIKSTGSDPELSEEGLLRVERLTSMLKEAGVEAIYSTDYKRTRNTVKPLANHLGLEIMLYNPRDKAFDKQILKYWKGKTVVVSGHSNTTPFIVNALIGNDKYEQLDDADHSKIFIITISGDEVHDMIINY